MGLFDVAAQTLADLEAQVALCHGVYRGTGPLTACSGVTLENVVRA